MNPWPIKPLTPKDLDFAVVNYDFTGLTADSLSELPSLQDGIDVILVDFSSSIANQTTLFESMTADLADLGNVLTELSNDDFDQILADLAGIASAGDGFLSDFAGLIG